MRLTTFISYASFVSYYRVIVRLKKKKRYNFDQPSSLLVIILASTLNCSISTFECANCFNNSYSRLLTFSFTS